MRLYSDTKNARLHDSDAPTSAPDSARIDDNWPTLEQVEFHRRNAEIIRSEAFADAARFALVFIRSMLRKLRRLPAKLRTYALKPGATA
ncbi:MAG: hypothetical protein ACI9JL_000778 [Paracoccaceae bacterium]|jgi:hypothetical protein